MVRRNAIDGLTQIKECCRNENYMKRHRRLQRLGFVGRCGNRFH
jgi:hypothetical protein